MLEVEVTRRGDIEGGGILRAIAALLWSGEVETVEEATNAAESMARGGRRGTDPPPDLNRLRREMVSVLVDEIPIDFDSLFVDDQWVGRARAFDVAITVDARRLPASIITLMRVRDLTPFIRGYARYAGWPHQSGT